MSNLQALLSYQATDKDLLKIEKQLAATDEKKKYAQARKFLKNAQSVLDGYEGKAIALANELSELENRYRKIADNLKEFSEIDFSELPENEEEVAYLKKNALALADTLKALKKSVDSVKEEMKTVTAEYEKLKKQTISMQKQFKEYKEKYEEVVKSKETETQSVRKKLSEIEKEIPAGLLERYKNKRKEGVWPVLCPLQVDSCSICSMNLPRAAMSKLAEDGVIECENCHRLIYKAE